MTGRRAPIERLVDLAVAIPLSVAVAARQLVPIGVTRLERRIARDLTLLQRSAGRRTAVVPVEDAPIDDAALPPASVMPVVADGAASDTASAVHDVVDLPIDGYDQLSARQIVDRLPSLTVDELAAIEAHERSRRRRQTVLARIAQLS